MAVRDFQRAKAYTDRHLATLGRGRDWAWAFWACHTPEGRAVVGAQAYGAKPADVDTNDLFFICQCVVDIQRFVFSDVGDALLDAPPTPATPEELDGMLGPATSRRMDAWGNVDVAAEAEAVSAALVRGSDFIFAGARLHVPDVEIVTFEDPKALSIVASAKTRRGKPRGYSRWPKPIDELAGKHWKFARALGFVHWDAGKSAASAFRTLIARGLGSTVGIDHPVGGECVAYQWLDPGLYYGWHGSSANPRSLISFDLSNAVYCKYARYYLQTCGVARPSIRIDGRNQLGRGNAFLGMYRGQLLTMLRILKAVSARVGLPLVFPVRPDGTPRGRNYKRLWHDDFHGVASHRHLASTTKWDVRGLEAQIIALLLTEPALMGEFPSLVASFRLHDAHWVPWLDKLHTCWNWAEIGI